MKPQLERAEQVMQVLGWPIKAEYNIVRAVIADALVEAEATGREQEREACLEIVRKRRRQSASWEHTYLLDRVTEAIRARGQVVTHDSPTS